MEEYEVDLRDYIRVLWREKWIILAVFAVAVASAVALSFGSPSQYATETTLLITPRVAERLVEGQISPIVETFSPNTYKSLAMANDLLADIIVSLDLRENPEKLMAVESLKKMINAKVEAGEGRGGEGFRFPLLTLTVRGSDPEEIARIANKWAELFIQRNIELLMTATAQSFDFIFQRFEEISENLKAKEEERKRYKQENPLETLQSEVKILRAKYEDFLSRLHSKRLELVEKSAQLKNIEEAIKDEPKFLELERSISNEAIWNFLGRNLKQRELEALPDLKVKDQQFNSIYFSLKSQLNQTRISVNSLQKEISYLEAKVEEFKKEIDEKVGKIAEIELTLEQMDREISTLKGTFDHLFNTLQEAWIAKEESLSSIRVVESAIIPEVPIGPNKRMNFLIAGVLGLFIGVLLAFFKHYMEGEPEKEKKEKKGSASI